jgi:hypothetical protein
MSNIIKGLPVQANLSSIPQIVSSFTHKIRVDGENGFSLAEGGNGRTKPVKTLADAKTLVEALLTEYGGNALIEVSPTSSAYDEDVTFPANTSLQGTSANNLNINGNIVFPSGNSISLRFVNFSGGDKSLTLNSAASMLDVYVSGKLLVNGVVVQSYNTHLVTSGQSALELVGSSAKFRSLIATIKTTGDFPAIEGNGTFIGQLCSIEGGSAAEYTIKSNTDGRIQLFNSVIQNPGFGASMDLRNGAASGDPNFLHGVMAIGDIVCGSDVTHVNDVSMKFGALTGTALIFESNKHHKNDSDVTGDTTAEALDTLKGLIEAVESGFNWKGTWDAATNTPEIVSGIGENGDYYRVSVPGTTEIDGISDWGLNDWIIFNGTKWQKIDNSDAVDSVNGKTGEVQLNADDIPYTPNAPGDWPTPNPAEVAEALDMLAENAGATDFKPHGDIFNLTETDITNKYFGPIDEPVTPLTHVDVRFEGFGDQIFGSGYSITSDHYITIKGLDGLLSSGQGVQVSYNKKV